MSVEIGRELKERLVREPKVIGLMGVIGSGKSTLAGLLKQELGVEVVEEKFGESPYLKKFYRNPWKWGYKSQMWFFNEKIRQLKSLDYSKSQLVDPAIEMDAVYAVTLGSDKIGFMRPQKLEKYKSKFAEVYGSLKKVGKIKKPDLIIWTDAPDEILAQRIIERGRSYELQMLEEYPQYLSALRDTIKSILYTGGLENVLYVNTLRTNFSDEVHINGILEAIKRKI